MAISIKPFEQGDFEQVREIYQLGIDTNLATFQTEAKDYAQWHQGMLSHSRLVSKQDDKVLGWAALSGVSDRCCYAGVAEVTVYIHPDAQGRGVGKQLLNALVDSSEQHGIWTLQAGIFSANLASVRLHEACGFRTVGVRHKLGKRGDKWIDVVLMERRSKTVGID